MTEREKVIHGLQMCIKARCGEADCFDCFYCDDKEGGCQTHLFQDAIALLKAQQPRVMTLEELDDLRGRGQAVYYEDRDVIAKCQDIFFVVASGIHAYFKGETYSMLKMVNAYGKTWRCWTSRPDEKTRVETPWDSWVRNE